MKTMLFRLCFLVLSAMPGLAVSAQTVIAFQGFESTIPCNDWAYSGGVVTTETRRTGTNALRVGRFGESTTVSFNAIDVTGLAGLQLTIHHAVRSGSGPGMDVREGAVMQVSINGVWSTIGQVGGFSDHAYGWNSGTAGSGSTTSPCSIFQCANPLVYNVPAGTTSIAFRAFSVSGGGNCTTFNTLMAGNAGSAFDRTDEGFQIDDISLTTTTTPVPFIWTGRVDTDWAKCRNWRYGVVPSLTSAVRIDQTALNHCEVYSANAQCASLDLVSNNANAWSLNIRAGRQLAVTNAVNVTRTGSTTPIGITLGSTGPATTGTFSCGNLTLSGHAAGGASAFFRNEVGTNTMLVRGHMVIENGGHLDLSTGTTGGLMQLQGNYQNNDGEAAFSEQGSLVWFSGSNAQTVGTNGFDDRFGAIRMGKSASDVSLAANVSMGGALGLAYTAPGGRLITSATALLTMENPTSTTGASDGSHVDGPLKKIGNTAFIFPVGEAGMYRPVQLTEIAGSSSDAFTVRYRRQSSYTAYGTNLDTYLDHVSDCEHWTVDRSSGFPNARVILSWNNTYSCGVDMPSDLRVAWWDAAAMTPIWRERGNDGATATAWGGWLPSGEVQNQLGPFTLGSATAMNPLPITLLHFTAIAQGNTVRCDWATVSEFDNDYFTVEKSANGVDFHAVGIVDAVGNSRALVTYDLIDPTPFAGLSYYRLRQTDIDGTTTVSQLVPVRFDERSTFTAWSDGAMIHVRGNAFEEAEYRLYDAAGRLEYATTASGGSFAIPVPASQLIHVLEVRMGSRVEHVRLLH